MKFAILTVVLMLLNVNLAMAEDKKINFKCLVSPYSGLDEKNKKLMDKKWGAKHQLLTPYVAQVKQIKDPMEVLITFIASMSSRTKIENLVANENGCNLNIPPMHRAEFIAIYRKLFGADGPGDKLLDAYKNFLLRQDPNLNIEQLGFFNNYVGEEINAQFEKLMVSESVKFSNYLRQDLMNPIKLDKLPLKKGGTPKKSSQ